MAHTGELGGAELALWTYLRHLPPHWRTAALLLAPGPLEAMLAELGIPVTVLPVVGRPSIPEAATLQRRLAGELRARAPSVILATGLKPATLCALPARAARVKLVWHKVDLTYDRHLTPTLSRLCRAVIPISAAVGESVPPARRLPAVPPPVRLPESFRVSPSRPPATLGSLGRLVPYKGHHHVIEAAGLLRGEFPEIRVTIAGGAAREAPDYPERLRETARALGLEDRVTFTGHVDRVEPVLEDLTMLVNATYRDEKGVGLEGLGASVIEAGWAGLPVVATRGGGIGEGLLDGVSGLLVPPGRPELLAGAVRRYLADPEAAGAAGEAGARHTRERFRPAEVSERLFGLLEEVAAGLR